MIRPIILFLAVAFFYTGVLAQSKQNTQYEKEAAALRKQVWDWDLPQFQTRVVPAEFAEASRVVLARHTELTAESKSKLKYYGFGIGMSKEQNITEITREMIKLNDKKSISDYSEFSFTQMKKSSDLFSFDRSTTYIGIRVIKADGSVKEIQADDIIRTKDERSEKMAKIAIPDLQAGDIIDYFTATQQQFNDNLNARSYTFTFFDDAPVLSLSFVAQLGKKYNVKYRSYNGAPRLVAEKTADDEITVSIEKTNMPAFETDLWVAPALQLPFVRLDISLGYIGLGRKSIRAENPGAIAENPESKEFLNAMASTLSNSFYFNYFMKSARDEYRELVAQAKKLAKQAGISYDDLSREEKAAHLYYTVRFKKLMAFDIDQLSRTINLGKLRFNGLAMPLFYTFKVANLDPEVYVGTPRTGFRMEEIMNTEDLTPVTYLSGTGRFFSIYSIFDVPMVAPSEIQGARKGRSITFQNKALGGVNTNFATVQSSGLEIQEATSDKNVRIDRLKMELSQENSNLLVHRSTTLRGVSKTHTQSNLILYEDLYEHERNAFKENLSLLESLKRDRKARKYVEEVKKAFSEARKNQKEAFEEEAKLWFEQEIKNLKDYKIVNPGIRHSSPDFIYSATFNLEGLVKKAGENYLIEIGKIQGSPLLIKDEQRDRNMDVYMSFARGIEYHIELKVPPGYAAEGVAELNKKVENKAGYFIAEAAVSGDVVSVKIRKHYLKTFIPKEEWNDVLAFTDAANEWVNAKILLKKMD